MLVALVSPIVRFALWVFFRRLEIRGAEKVPRHRPVLLVANHPNVMLDTLVLGAALPTGPPRFLGKSTLFKNTCYGFFLRHLGVIPVARPQDGSGTGGNQDMLRQACQVLRQGHALALFPEGGSLPGRQVRQLKPGGARIALRVEDESQGRAGVCIVPVGLAYTDPGLFRSDVAVHFGEPIEVSPFLGLYRQRRSAGARKLTDLVQQRLTALTWHLDNPALETVFADLAQIYTDQVAADLPDSAELGPILRAGQQLINGIEHFSATEPELVRQLGQRLRLHHRKLRRLRLEPYIFAPETQGGPGHFFAGLALAPLALYGFLNNALPYFLPRLLVRPYRQSPEMVGTVKLAAGALTFPIFYLLRTSVVWSVWGWQWALPFVLSLPLSGLFTLYYNEYFLQRWPLWQNLIAPRRRRHYLRRLGVERAALLADLDALKRRYLDAERA
ncbi:MAG: hypothetical protein GKR89_01005 [Candidatus Latescibacteria bacterium]|nr:hypothetical protein [Candidatus Latescibacterota bacterium]